jgi:hypothetical protein
VTKDELQKLKAHSRIKYIGSDQAVIQKLNQVGTYSKKGTIKYYSYDNSSSYSTAQSEGIVMGTTAGNFKNVNPEDWIVLDDRRTDLAIKYAERDVRERLDRFTRMIGDLKNTQRYIDRDLTDIPLSDKLKILTTLSEEQRAWWELMSHPTDVVIAAIKKVAVELDEAEAPVEKKEEVQEQATTAPSGSNGI